MTKAADEVYAVLKRQFRGELLRPSDDGYEQARVIWNGMMAKTPGLIARCTDVADIQAALRAASSTYILTAVRCGGHSLAGHRSCDGGLMIDLSRMRAVRVEPEHRRASFAGGCLHGNIYLATHPTAWPFRRASCPTRERRDSSWAVDLAGSRVTAASPATKWKDYHGDGRRLPGSC